MKFDIGATEALILWRVKSLDGNSQHVEAYTADEAIAKAGLTRGQCAKWSPFPIKTVPDLGEQARRKEVFQRLKELKAERHRLCSNQRPAETGQQQGGKMPTAATATKTQQRVKRRAKVSEEQEKRVTIKDTVHEALKAHGADYNAVHKAVKIAFPKSKFNESHMRWYINHFGMDLKMPRKTKAKRTGRDAA